MSKIIKIISQCLKMIKEKKVRVEVPTLFAMEI